MKRLIIILFALFYSVSSFAQTKGANLFEDGQRRFFGGITVGLNATQVDGDSYSGFHSAGLNAGGLVYWFFAKDIAGSIEFLYSQKGSHGVTETYSPYAGSYFAKYKMKVNYIEVPLVFHYLFNEKYILGLGGSFNALLSSHESMSDMGTPVSFDPGEYPFNAYTFDIIGGLGMLLGTHYIVEARYQYGLTPMRDWQNVAAFQPGMGNRSQYNNMFAFRLVYLF